MHAFGLKPSTLVRRQFRVWPTGYASMLHANSLASFCPRYATWNIPQSDGRLFARGTSGRMLPTSDGRLSPRASPTCKLSQYDLVKTRPILILICYVCNAVEKYRYALSDPISSPSLPSLLAQRLQSPPEGPSSYPTERRLTMKQQRPCCHWKGQHRCLQAGALTLSEARPAAWCARLALSETSDRPQASWWGSQSRHSWSAFGGRNEAFSVSRASASPQLPGTAWPMGPDPPVSEA